MAKKEKVRHGNIVTIVSRFSQYNGKQGEVVEINHDDKNEDGAFGVRFHRSQMLNHVSSPEDCIVRHRRNELQIDQDWNVESRALRVYGRMYHTTYSLCFDFSPKNPCMREGCTAHAVKRCVFNCWGSVFERDWCTEHAKLDGWSGDLVPETKKDYVPATPMRDKEAA